MVFRNTPDGSCCVITAACRFFLSQLPLAVAALSFGVGQPCRPPPNRPARRAGRFRSTSVRKRRTSPVRFGPEPPSRERRGFSGASPRLATTRARSGPSGTAEGLRSHFLPLWESLRKAAHKKQKLINLKPKWSPCRGCAHLGRDQITEEFPGLKPTDRECCRPPDTLAIVVDGSKLPDGNAARVLFLCLTRRLREKSR